MKHISKGIKYQELEEQCRRQGWKTSREPVEVGCQASAGQSFCKALAKLRLVGLAEKRAIKSVTDTPERTTSSG